MRVMRQRKAFDRQIAKLESRSSVEDPPIRLVLQFRFNGPGGHQIGVDYGIEFLGEGGDACRVIAVLVGDENRVDLFGANTSLLHHAAESFTTETGVNQDTAILGDEQSAVARAAAAENRELHGHWKGLFTWLFSFSNTKSKELGETGLRAGIPVLLAFFFRRYLVADCEIQMCFWRCAFW